MELFGGISLLSVESALATAPLAEEGEIKGVTEGEDEIAGDIVSASHPDPACWYFDNVFEAAWPEFAPGAEGFLWIVDQSPDTDPEAGTATFTTERQMSYPDTPQGSWWLHLAAADAAGQPLTEGRAHFRFNVYEGPVEFSTNFLVEPQTPIRDADVFVDAHLYTGDWDEAEWQDLTPQSQTGFWQPRYDHGVLAHDGALWVIGGYVGDPWREYDYPFAWRSENGVDWSVAAEVQGNVNDYTRAIVYRGQIETYSSSGHPATQSGWNNFSVGFAAAVFRDSRWLLGGRSPYVEEVAPCKHDPKTEGWEEGYSDDWGEGCDELWPYITEAPASDVCAYVGYVDREIYPWLDGWECETAPWRGRMYPAAAAFQGELWVLGGLWREVFRGFGVNSYGKPPPAGEFLNDVWRSSGDGTWTSAVEHAPWAARARHAALVQDGRLWVLGGHLAEQTWNPYYPLLETWTDGGPADFLNDVWVSSNGEDWELFEATAPWAGRYGHAAASFDGKIWILGGKTAEGLSNEVWCLGRAELPSTCVAGYRYVIDQSPDTLPTSEAPLVPSSRIPVHLLRPGTNWLHMAAEDTLGNLSAPGHYALNVAYLAPVIASSTHPDPARGYPARDAAFSWTDPLEVSVAYRYVFDARSYTIPSADSPSTTFTEFALSNVAEGLHYLHVRGEDAGGNLSETAHRRVYVRRAQEPSVQSPTHPDSSIEYPSNEVTFTWTDPDGLAVGYRYVLNRSYALPGATDPYTTENSVTLSGVGEGTWYFRIMSVDMYGNSSYSSGRAIIVATEAAVDYPPRADFEISPVSGNTPLKTTWQNRSDLVYFPLRSWSLDFGDGTVLTGFGVLGRKDHTYQNAGTYTVSLTVATSGGTDTETKAGCVQVLPPLPPEANFWMSNRLGDPPLYVSFGSASNPHGVPFLTWSVDFGDGTVLTGSGNPPYNTYHYYEYPGYYTISLTVTTAGGTDTETKTNWVHVLGDTQPNGVFSADLNANSRIELSELLRVIQLYNIRGFDCAESSVPTEDGYRPGGGENHSCAPHSSDYAPQDWRIGLSELLRLIQFYNTLGFHPCPTENTEDGFCPGA
jgi:PKD repeat protein